MAKRAYRTKLKLNNRERGYLASCAGFSRYVWNWSLAMHDEMWRNDESPRLTGGNAKYPDNPSIKSRFRAVETVSAQHPFAREYPSQIVDNSIANLQKAFSNYWGERKKGTTARTIAQKKASGSWGRWIRKQLKYGRKGVQAEPGYPQYKSRHLSRPSFAMSFSKVEGDCLFFGAAKGSVWSKHEWRLAEKDRVPDGVYKTTTFSREPDGAWYVSVMVDFEPEPVSTTGEIIGIDIGVATAVAASDGTMYENNRRLAQYEKRLKILQRKLCRQQLNSNNWKKTKREIGKLHAKISRARAHDRHNITADLVYKKRPSVIRLEDLQVRNMTRRAKPKRASDDEAKYLRNNRSQKAGLNRALLEVAPHELRRQIEYKADWAGINVEAVPPAYTSQTCSQCGHVAKENRPSQSVFLCVSCGHTAHADVNAACVIRDVDTGS